MAAMKNKTKKIFNKSLIINILLILVIMPLTLYLFLQFGERKYYLVSVLIIVYSIIPFLLLFEIRKPQAKELVMLAVLTALAVAARVIFIAIPHFKPMGAFVIIAGVAFGPQSGFLVGVLSAFVSGFFFGQGLWTPWQMFAFGVLGFLSGILFQKRVIKKDRTTLAIFGGLATVFLVGPILDTSTLFIASSIINIETAATIYLAGVPVNLIHAASVAITLFLLSNPMFEKLDRVKRKYGMGLDLERLESKLFLEDSEPSSVKEGSNAI